MPAQAEDVLELDELWSFVHCKLNQVGIWIALCRRTRQVVARMPGDRSHLTCRTLWQKIPLEYKQGLCFSDFWDAYEKAVPQEQHVPCAKQEGQTNHVERFNLTLRQRVGRLTRQTLSFSKHHLWHLRHLRLFFVTYNRRKAKEYRLRLSSRTRHRSITS